MKLGLFLAAGLMGACFSGAAFAQEKEFRKFVRELGGRHQVKQRGERYTYQITSWPSKGGPDIAASDYCMPTIYMSVSKSGRTVIDATANFDFRGIEVLEIAAMKSAFNSGLADSSVTEVSTDRDLLRFGATFSAELKEFYGHDALKDVPIPASSADSALSYLWQCVRY